MPKRIEWDYWRTKYISGEDYLTLEELSRMPNAPSLDAIKKRSARESWSEQRRTFRTQAPLRAAQVISDALQDTHLAKELDRQAQKLIDVAETITRQLQIAKAFQAKLVQRLKTLDPSELNPRDMATWLKVSVDIERLAYGMATEKIEYENNIDLKGLSDEELEKIAQGEKVDNGSIIAA